MNTENSFFFLVDRRDSNFDAVYVILANKAFMEKQPFPGTASSSHRMETLVLSDEVVKRLSDLMKSRGLDPPFPPGGGSLFVAGTAGLSERALDRKHYSSEDTLAVECARSLQHAFNASGQDVIEIPDWITHDAILSILARESRELRSLGQQTRDKGSSRIRKLSVLLTRPT